MAKKKPARTSPAELDFEQIAERLEQIVRRLEEGELGLSESLQYYEEGVKLLRRAYRLLEKAERKIELLSGIDEQGNPVTTPFEHSASFDPDQPDASTAARRQGRKTTPPRRQPEGPENC